MVFHDNVGEPSEGNLTLAFVAHENSIDFAELGEQVENLLFGGSLGWESLDEELLFVEYLVVLSGVSLVHGFSSNGLLPSDEVLSIFQNLTVCGFCLEGHKRKTLLPLLLLVHREVNFLDVSVLGEILFNFGR